MHRLIAPLMIVIVCSPGIALTETNWVSGKPRVVDGDTIHLRGEKIRIHGIDAPETAQVCFKGQAVWECGAYAKVSLKDMISDREVSCEGQKRDRYDRLIAKCWVGNQDIGKWMVQNGWAFAYQKYSKDYIHEEQEAQKNLKGLWASDHSKPWDWRREIRGGSSKGSVDIDRDCNDFQSQKDAQEFFLKNGPGDPHRLDSDGNGIVCEGLPNN